MITGSGEVDTYTLPLLGSQTLDLVVTPESGGLQPVVTLYDPSGNLIATATAAGPGPGGLSDSADDQRHRHSTRSRCPTQRQHRRVQDPGPAQRRDRSGRPGQQHDRHGACRSTAMPRRSRSGPSGSRCSARSRAATPRATPWWSRPGTTATWPYSTRRRERSRRSSPVRHSPTCICLTCPRAGQHVLRARGL